MAERILYFAYGSNMDLGQMRIRCPNGYDVLGIGKLKEWKIFINSRGYANIFPKLESQVLGLVFDLKPQGLRSLDRYEGYPHLYTRRRLLVVLAERIVEPWVYVDENNIEIGNPRPGYLEKVVESAKRFMFPDEYVANLESFFNNKKLHP